MDNYYKCAFRYYVSFVLKLNIYEENFMNYIKNNFIFKFLHNTNLKTMIIKFMIFTLLSILTSDVNLSNNIRLSAIADRAFILTTRSVPNNNEAVELYEYILRSNETSFRSN